MEAPNELQVATTQLLDVLTKHNPGAIPLDVTQLSSIERIEDYVSNLRWVVSKYRRLLTTESNLQGLPNFYLKRFTTIFDAEISPFQVEVLSWKPYTRREELKHRTVFTDGVSIVTKCYIDDGMDYANCISIDVWLPRDTDEVIVYLYDKRLVSIDISDPDELDIRVSNFFDEILKEI